MIQFQLEIVADSCHLSFKDKAGHKSTLTVEIGVETLAQQIFRHAPPSPIELEHAIERVEDAIMQVQALVPRGLAVCSLSAQVLLPWASDPALPATREATTLRLQAVEALLPP